MGANDPGVDPGAGGEPRPDPAADAARPYARHEEASVVVPAKPADVFDHVDDHERFYSHVVRLSKVAGGLALDMDASQGRAVGSRMRLAGTFFGARLALEEVVTRREPPHVKTWETVGEPRFLIVGRYRMSVHVEPEGEGSLLRFALDYDEPRGSGPARRALCRSYARTCAREMIALTRKRFARRAP